LFLESLNLLFLNRKFVEGNAGFRFRRYNDPLIYVVKQSSETKEEHPLSRQIFNKIRIKYVFPVFKSLFPEVLFSQKNASFVYSARRPHSLVPPTLYQQ
jgi:hypothetical protein